MKLNRGLIVKANLGQERGNSIQVGIRPVVIVSNNRCNSHSRVISVVPLTSKVEEKKKLPTHVLLKVNEQKGLKKDSLALCEQVTLLPITDIIDENYGQVTESSMAEITQALQVQLGVFNEYN